jgi:hypothetical protein
MDALQLRKTLTELSDLVGIEFFFEPE